MQARFWRNLQLQQPFHVIMVYKVVETFESGDEILKFDYPNESYSGPCFPVILPVCYAVQGGFNAQDCGSNPKVYLSK